MRLGLDHARATGTFFGMSKSAGTTNAKPNAKAVKEFFKYISLDLTDKVSRDLAAGMDPNVTFDQGFGPKTALMAALGRRKAWPCAPLLLDAGADVRIAGAHGNTALHEVGDVDLAKRILDAGADIEAMGTEHSHGTPLHAAAAAERKDVVELLLARGAKVDAVNAKGLTPYAVTRSYPIRQLLLAHGAKPLGIGGRVFAPKPSEAKAEDVDVSRGALGIDRAGRPWFAGYAGTFRLDGGKLTRFFVPGTPAVDCILAGRVKGEDAVFFATNQGLLVIVGDEEWRILGTQNSDVFDSHLIHAATAPDGRVAMLGYEHEHEEKHIAIFDGERVTVLASGKDYPPGVAPVALGFDAANNLVIGGQKGAALPDGKGGFVVDALDEDALMGEHVWSIATVGESVFLAGSILYEHRAGAAVVKHEDVRRPSLLAAAGSALWVVTSESLVRIEGTARAVFTKADHPQLSGIEGIAWQPGEGDGEGRLWIRAGKDPLVLEGGTIRTLAEFVASTNGAAKEAGGVAAGVASAEASAKDISAKDASSSASQDAAKTGASKGAPTASPPNASPPKERKPRLVPFPPKPFVKKLPPEVDALFAKAKLSAGLADNLRKIARPAIAFDVAKADKLPVGASKFGGKPDLPKGADWPTYKRERSRPLPFVFQVNLADVTAFDAEGLLPKKGMLYVFSDTRPDEIEDAKVVYHPGPAKTLARQDFPEDLQDRKDQDDFVAMLPEFALTFFSLYTLPSNELLGRRAVLTDDDEEAIDTLRTKLVKLAGKKLPEETSRILGWPQCHQEEVVTKEDPIVLFQLNGFGLSLKKARDVFEYWCSDGLIHFLLARKHLDDAQFDKAKHTMGYT